MRRQTSGEFGGGLGSGVGLDSVEEIVSTFRVFDVLNSEVDSLLHVSVSDDLVHDNSDSSSGNVVDNTGSTRFRRFVSDRFREATRREN